jgi:FAD/FMN-containing dehydrogenase
MPSRDRSTSAAEFRGLPGSVALPEDPEFPSLRKPFVSGLVEQVPQAVAQCASPAEVAAAVAFAQDRKLPFAVRSGGHSFADLSSTDGLLIDLGRMDAVQLDGELVTVGPGLRLGRLAERLIEHGRVLPCGWSPVVGVGGALLGGGFGVLSRYLGLGCDHLAAAQVVLADGRMAWVDEAHEPELFWALRGAGWAGFGVVTALVLRTYPAPRLTRFVHRWPWSRAAEVIDAWQRWAPSAPAEVNAELALHAADSLREPQVTLFGAVVGTAADARALLAELWSRVDPDGEVDELTELSARASAVRHTFAGMPVADHSLPMTMGQRPWLRRVRTEFFDRPIPAEAVGALVAALPADPGPGQFREVELIPWGGAYRRLAPDATAFPHRQSLFQIGHHGLAGHQATDEERAALAGWVDRSWQTVHPWGSGRVYPNYPDRALAGWAEAYFGGNLPRLREIKSRYDPDDVFRSAQSVPPG